MLLTWGDYLIPRGHPRGRGETVSTVGLLSVGFWLWAISHHSLGRLPSAGCWEAISHSQLSVWFGMMLEAISHSSICGSGRLLGAVSHPSFAGAWVDAGGDIALQHRRVLHISLLAIPFFSFFFFFFFFFLFFSFFFTFSFEF